MTRSILIVDDDPAILRLVERLLARTEWQVRTAGDGRQAVELLARAPADAVVTDLEMPHVDGLALTQHVARHFPATHVVVLTSRGSEQSAVECFRAGAADYVRKSDISKRLLPAVRRLLAADDGPAQTEWDAKRRGGLALHVGLPCHLTEVQTAVLLRQVERLHKWSGLVSSSTSIRNRRRHARRMVCTLVDLIPVHEESKVSAGARRQGICRDLSEGGCSVVHLRPAFECPRLAIVLPPPRGTPMTLVARIVRDRRVSSDVWELGLEFAQRIVSQAHPAAPSQT